MGPDSAAAVLGDGGDEEGHPGGWRNLALRGWDLAPIGEEKEGWRALRAKAGCGGVGVRPAGRAGRGQADGVRPD